MTSSGLSNRRVTSLATHAFLCLSLVVLLLPIAWMISTSVKPIEEIFRTPPVWIPDSFDFQGYRDGFSPTILRLFLNSLIVAILSAVFATLAGSLTAYGLSRIQFRANKLILLALLSTLAFPIPLLMIAIYLGFAKLGLLNTYFSLIFGHVAITIPIVVWIMKDFFDSVPIEVEEAAIVDGAGPFFLLFRIVFPMARPGLTAASIFVFVTSWNEFVFGLTFVSDPDYRPLPAGISLMFMEEFQYRWAELMAVAVCVTIPVLVVFILFQKQFLRGVTAGAVKG